MAGNQKRYSDKEVLQMLLESDSDDVEESDDDENDLDEASDSGNESDDTDVGQPPDDGNESENDSDMDTTVQSTSLPTTAMINTLDWKDNTGTGPTLPAFSGTTGVLLDTTDF